jgi:hypothetical protein
VAAEPAVKDPIGPELKQLLRHLKLGKMLDTLPERLTLAKQVQRALGHAEFLELVLADEHTRREAKSAQLRARAVLVCHTSLTERAGETQVSLAAGSWL